MLGTLAASISGNVVTGKGVIPAGEDVIRAGQNLPPHPLINFGIQKYYQNKFDGVFPRTYFKRN